MAFNAANSLQPFLPMKDPQLVSTLARWLAGEFENQAQALENPAWFVHLHLWHRPLPQRLDGKLALFGEQANVLNLKQAYRQRILLLSETQGTNQLQGQYLALKCPEQFRGSGLDPNLLESITLTDLEWLPGCVLTVTEQDGTFSAQMAPNTRCRFEYQGKTIQVALGFEARASQFLSYDRGIDPESGQALWGALMGPYQFKKCQDFSQALPLN